MNFKMETVFKKRRGGGAGGEAGKWFWAEHLFSMYEALDSISRTTEQQQNLTQSPSLRSPPPTSLF